MGQVIRFQRSEPRRELVMTAMLAVALASFGLAILVDVPVLLIPSGLGFVAFMLI